MFGSLLTVHGLSGDGWAAVGIAAGALLLARPIAIGIALTGTRITAAGKAFMAWFGPKGVSTMAFSLLILSRRVEAGERIFNLAALTVLASILLHGVTDTAGPEWIARRRAPDAGASEHGDLQDATPTGGAEPPAAHG